MNSSSRHLSRGSPAYKRAKELLKTDPDQAVAALICLASDGDTRSITELARCYAAGLGTEKDPAKAESLLRKAVDAGDMWAYFLLGRLCFRQKRYQEARESLAIAAAAGFSPALHDMGKIYLLGLGVEKNLPKAKDYFERAMNAGSLFAKARLGRILLKEHFLRSKLKGAYLLLGAILKLFPILFREGFNSVRLVE
jgi:tetratricopeptide (TPR) repeat protein